MSTAMADYLRDGKEEELCVLPRGGDAGAEAAGGDAGADVPTADVELDALAYHQL